MCLKPLFPLLLKTWPYFNYKSIYIICWFFDILICLFYRVLCTWARKDRSEMGVNCRFWSSGVVWQWYSSCKTMLSVAFCALGSLRWPLGSVCCCCKWCRRLLWAVYNKALTHSTHPTLCRGSTLLMLSKTIWNIPFSLCLDQKVVMINLMTAANVWRNTMTLFVTSQLLRVFKIQLYVEMTIENIIYNLLTVCKTQKHCL